MQPHNSWLQLPGRTAKCDGCGVRNSTGSMLRCKICNIQYCPRCFSAQNSDGSHVTNAGALGWSPEYALGPSGGGSSTLNNDPVGEVALSVDVVDETSVRSDQVAISPKKKGGQRESPCKVDTVLKPVNAGVTKRIREAATQLNLNDRHPGVLFERLADFDLGKEVARPKLTLGISRPETSRASSEPPVYSAVTQDQSTRLEKRARPVSSIGARPLKGTPAVNFQSRPANKSGHDRVEMAFLKLADKNELAWSRLTASKSGDRSVCTIRTLPKKAV